MFGYACRETDVLMPAPIYFAHSILQSLAEARHSGAQPLLGPDAKSQVTLRYENHKPVCATSIVVSTQHGQSIDQDEVREIVAAHVRVQADNPHPDARDRASRMGYAAPSSRAAHRMRSRTSSWSIDWPCWVETTIEVAQTGCDFHSGA